MKIAVLGTGAVGVTIANKLIALGHEVRMGARDAHNEKAAAWAKAAGDAASYGTFSDAAAASELVFNCTSGGASKAALTAAGADNLLGKIIIDVANPLDFSRGMPPSMLLPSTESLGEHLQIAFPRSRIVKALNTVNANVMVDPAKLADETDVFVCGDDPAAKAEVTALLKTFGWTSVIDLGPIAAARGLEMYLMMWLRLYGAVGTADFNIKVVTRR